MSFGCLWVREFEVVFVFFLGVRWLGGIWDEWDQKTPMDSAWVGFLVGETCMKCFHVPSGVFC